MRIYLLTLIGVAVLSGCASSGNRFERDTGNQVCDSFYEAAGSVMGMRQSGISMSDAMTVAETSQSRMLKGMIQAAYSSPLYPTREEKESETLDFANKVYEDCINVRNQTENSPPE